MMTKMKAAFDQLHHLGWVDVVVAAVAGQEHDLDGSGRRAGAEDLECVRRLPKRRGHLLLAATRRELIYLTALE